MILKLLVYVIINLSNVNYYNLLRLIRNNKDLNKNFFKINTNLEEYVKLKEEIRQLKNQLNLKQGLLSRERLYMEVVDKCLKGEELSGMDYDYETNQSDLAARLFELSIKPPSPQFSGEDYTAPMPAKPTNPTGFLRK